MDRGYVDTSRLHRLHEDLAYYFVIRARSNVQCRRVYSHPVDKSLGLKHDQTIFFSGLLGVREMITNPVRMLSESF